MCNKSFAVLFVLALVGSTLAGTDGDNNAELMIYYTMEDCINRGYIGPIGNGKEHFNSSDGIDYGPGLFDGALVISNDGMVNPPDPAEMGDFVDIEEGAEILLAPFENRTVSLWFRETGMLNPDNHWSYPATGYLFGTRNEYYSMIMLQENTEDIGGPDLLVAKLGGENATATGAQYAELGYIPIHLGEWHHVAVTLANYGDTNDVGHNCVVAMYMDGVCVGRQYQCTRFSDNKYGITSLSGATVCAYEQEGGIFYQIPDGVEIDDFAIIDMALGDAGIAGIYQRGLAGQPIPEPATVLLLGLGLVLLRRNELNKKPLHK